MANHRGAIRMVEGDNISGTTETKTQTWTRVALASMRFATLVSPRLTSHKTLRVCIPSLVTRSSWGTKGTAVLVPVRNTDATADYTHLQVRTQKVPPDSRVD